MQQLPKLLQKRTALEDQFLPQLWIKNEFGGRKMRLIDADELKGTVND